MKPAQFAFESIGTGWTIDIFDKNSPIKEELYKSIRDRIQIFDKTYSRFRSDSLITEMSKLAGEYTMPGDAKKLLTLYEKLYYISEGSFTPLIGSVLEDAGYDATYSLKEQRRLQSPLAWDEVILYKHPKLTIKVPAILDFGAAGKGYIVDIIGEILDKNGIQSFCIDAGGDILHKNITQKTIRIGLEHPQNPKQVIGVATISNQSICGSAGNRRKWGKYHHIMNPYTLTPQANLVAVWATAKEAIVADAITTALFFVPAKKLLNYYAFDYLILYPDYTIEKSKEFAVQLYYDNK